MFLLSALEARINRREILMRENNSDNDAPKPTTPPRPPFDPSDVPYHC